MKSKLAHVDGNPQRSDVAHPIYCIVRVSFDLTVRLRTALVLTPCSLTGRGAAPRTDRRMDRPTIPLNDRDWVATATNPTDRL
ncbi:hypothetical protein EHI42_31670 [Rhizobium hidalgonense]|nr:hypothetical protein EHI42_31670 [Rhizobium hidalgonense]